MCRNAVIKGFTKLLHASIPRTILQIEHKNLFVLQSRTQRVNYIEITLNLISLVLFIVISSKLNINIQ